MCTTRAVHDKRLRPVARYSIRSDKECLSNAGISLKFQAISLCGGMKLERTGIAVAIADAHG